MAALRRAAPLLLFALVGCGKVARECRAVTARANAFIAESARVAPAPGASRARTQEQALATAARYEKLAADLEALHVTSGKLEPEVQSYRTLALRSAVALRAVAKALGEHDFETARARRVELDRAAQSEAPLVARINAICAR